MTSLKFVPPPEEAKTPQRYASYVVGEGMKLHGSVGHAKLSFSNRGWTWAGGDPNAATWGERRGKRVTKHGFILENIDGSWWNLYEIKPGLSEAELPWVKKYYRDTKYSWSGSYRVDQASESQLKSIAENPDRFRFEYRTTPMTREEYVQFRLAVQLEQYMEKTHPVLR